MSDKYPGGFVTAGAPAGFSVAFNGSTDYLTCAVAASPTGTQNFTIEGWIYVPSASTEYAILDNNNSSGGFYLRVNTSGQINVVHTNTAGVLTSATSIRANAWNYFCVTRSGNTFNIYLNSTSVDATTSNSVSFSTGSSTLIGAYYNGALNFSGYMSNLRVVIGTATAPTVLPTQFFPVSGTALLTCQSPTIIDNSTNNYTLTSVGTPRVSNFTPFAAYTGFNPALGAAAGGVWTLDEAAYYQNNRQWPIYDPYFKNTTLMLHGNGTNGAQNNTFLDSSTNNFTITRNGNTTQGTFTPFSQTGWSNYFNGATPDYITATSNAAYQFGTGNFTIEFWINHSTPSSAITYPKVFQYADDGNYTNGYGAYFNTSSTTFNYNGPGASYTLTGTVAANSWNHIAIVRNSSTTTLYINGVSVSSNADSSNYNYAGTYPFAIGGGRNGAGTYINSLTGYISNFRVVKGSAVYTSNFTPSTAPLTAVTGTSLLTCQSQRFVDNSANNFSLTVNGTPSVQAFSPFVPAYITPTTYSNWFDGSGDYLTVPNAAWMNLGTGDFTMECWVQFNSVSSTQMFVSNNYNAGTGGGGWAFLYRQDNTTLKFSCNSNVSYEKTWSPAVGTMYHVAVCRSGTDLRLFVNGVQLGTTSTSSDNISGASSTLDVGTNLGGTPLPINGVISNMRIVTSALYTASFTPPTAPLTAVTNTQLLTCQSSTFIDNSANAATLTANGNVQPVTSPTPFPAKVDTTTLNSAYSTSLIGGSAYFDGSGDYLTAANNAAFNLPADFTIECWWYPMDLSGSSNLFCIGDSRASYNGLLLYWSTGAGKLILYSNGANVVVSSLSTPINTWYHLAAVRSGSTVTFYINGASVGTATNTTTFTGLAGNGFAVGAEYYGTFDSSRKMYLTGSRLVKGTAVYTSNFAPPITPPTAVTNTQLLLNYTNGAIFDSTAKNVLETVGTAQISTTQSKYGGSSIKTDGSTSSWVLVPFNRNLDISTGAPDWTIELWGYVVSFANSPYFFNKGGVAASTYTNYGIEMTTGGVVSLALGNNGGQTSYSFGTCVINTWYHFAATRQGNTIRTFLNGTLVTNTTLGTTMTDNGEALYIGCLKNLTSQVLNGYVDDLRITKGVARYVTNFTPPTSQLQDQ